MKMGLELNKSSIIIDSNLTFGHFEALLVIYFRQTWINDHTFVDSTT